MTRRVLILGLVLSLALVVGLAGPASAACHDFTVSVDPVEVVEGEAVTVTVSRDAAIAPSSIDVSTADETAVSGVDYEPLDETADFPDGGTEQTFTISTIAHAEAKGSRTFRVELDNPQGCDVNSNYVVGDPAVVTIVDAEESAEPAAPPAEPGEEPAAPAAPDTPPADDAGANVPAEAAPTAGGTLADTGRASALLPGALALVAALLAIGLLRRQRV